MSSWNPQHYRFDGERQGVPGAVIDSALAIMERIRRVDPRMTPVFTLRHLSEMTGTRYGLLRSVVARRTHPYKVFTLKKAIPGRTRVRLICTPNRELKTTQDWIVRNILQHTRAHPASYAYHPGSRPEFAARMHCGCDFLLKVDIEDFFTRVTEGKICEVFEGLGYPDLIAFELARLTTVVASGGKSPSVDPAVRWPTIKAYQHAAEGFLPQGAPTSPMLSNLVMRHLDDRFAAMAAAANMKYTRYADDLAFSARKPHTRATVAAFKRKVLRELSEAGYRPNLRKTAINTTTQQMLSVSSNLRAKYGQANKFGAITTSVAVRAGVIPEFLRDGTGTTATNPYGGAITLVPASLNGTNDSVQVTWPNVPKDQCSDIVTNIEREMRQVSVGSTVVKDGGGPMDIEALETACDAATAVTIDFWVGRS